MTTRKRQLRHGRSIWFSYRTPRVRARKIGAGAGQVSTDILIIGAGITGALLAEMMSANGYSVVLVDRRGPFLGSTAASTALVLYELDMPMTRLNSRIGAENTIRAWRRSRLAVDNLLFRTTHLGISCQVQSRNALYVNGNILDAEGLGKEADARNHAGLETAFLSRADLSNEYGIKRSAALLSHGNVAVNPRQLTAGYLKAAIGNGASLFAPAEVVELVEERNGVMATVKQGRKLRAKFAIYASGYELPKSLDQRSLRIASTFALATKRQKSRLWKDCAFIWEASDPYLFIRTTNDGRVICGGEDEDFADEDARNALLDRKIARLESKLEKLVPRIDATADFTWTANFGTSTTGLPRIGRLAGHKRTFGAFGYGGNGITYSRIAAELLLSGIQGRPDPDADLFEFRS